MQQPPRPPVRSREGATARRSPGRAGHAWRKASAAVKARATYCWLCLGALDPRLRWPSPWCTTVHHVVPLSLGGDPTDPANLVAAHRKCNEKVGARIVREGALAEVQPDRLNASRRW